VKRREFITLLGGAAAAWPRAAYAQAAPRPARIGILAFGHDALANPLFDTFREEMHKLGHVEGRSYVLDFRPARGDPNRLQRLAIELSQIPVDVILTDGGAASIAASEATATIPIVMGVISDPVAIGLAASLARPGGNVTGFSIMSPELGAKRLALLKEVVADATLIGVLVNPASPVTGAQQLAPIREAAGKLGMDIMVGEAQSPDSISAAIDRLAAGGVSGLMGIGDAVLFRNRQLIADRAVERRLPGIYAEREFAEAGGLMAYGPNVPDNFRRAAGYVTRILRGEQAAELPIEQPVKFQLVINLKTAKALGIEVPLTLLARADEVIE
jgi:putative ABC transport system substrate-binding protein